MADDKPLVLDTPEAIHFARVCALRGALGLEIKGLRRSRGRTAYSLLKDLGFRGSRLEVLTQVSIYVTDRLNKKEGK